METIKKLSGLSKKYLRPVIALGMIDGTAMVFTFSNHPLSILNPESEPLAISSKSFRREIFESFGVAVLIEIPFTKDLSKKSPEEFLKLLQEKILYSSILHKIFLNNNGEIFWSVG